jgi:FtsZ-binding cell division protein ZapB
MPEPQHISSISADTEGIAKIVLMVLGSGFVLKATVALINRVWDRFIKQDEYEHQSRDRYEKEGWDKFNAERQLSDTLRKEYATIREQLYTVNTQHALQGLEIDKLKEENAELSAENERFRKILDKLNREH